MILKNVLPFFSRTILSETAMLGRNSPNKSTTSTPEKMPLTSPIIHASADQMIEVSTVFNVD